MVPSFLLAFASLRTRPCRPLKVLEHVARVNGKLDVLGLDFSGQVAAVAEEVGVAAGEGDTLRLEVATRPSYGPEGMLSWSEAALVCVFPQAVEQQRPKGQ